MMMGKKHNNKILIIGLAVALVCVVLGVFVFSYAMETLDVKAQQLGASEQPIYSAPFADYTLGGSNSPWVALAVGITATLLIFGVGFGVAKVLRKKKGKTQ
jgi:hypothetical protein